MNKGMKVIIPNPKNIVQSRGNRPLPKRTIDRSKPKVRLDGTADPTCLPCQQRKVNRLLIPST